MHDAAGARGHARWLLGPWGSKAAVGGPEPQAQGSRPLAPAVHPPWLRAAPPICAARPRAARQAGDRLHKFAESDALQKDLAASHTAYAAAVEKVVSGLAQTLDELRRLDRACADAFGAHRAAFEQLQKGEAAAAAAAELPPRDLWISEFAYRSSAGWKIRPLCLRTAPPPPPGTI